MRLRGLFPESSALPFESLLEYARAVEVEALQKLAAVDVEVFLPRPGLRGLSKRDDATLQGSLVDPDLLLAPALTTTASPRSWRTGSVRHQ